MKYICNNKDRIFMAMLIDRLNEERIQFVIKNQFRRNSQLYIMDNHKFERAQAIKSTLIQKQEEAKDEAPWQCLTCGERLEPQFNICWKCGHPNDSH